jgi:hypothetical protein
MTVSTKKALLDEFIPNLQVLQGFRCLWKAVEADETVTGIIQVGRAD